MATIGNMGAEVGATSSIFPYTQSMGDYLRHTEREGIARAAEGALGYLSRDEGSEYDRHIEIVSHPSAVHDYLGSRLARPINDRSEPLRARTSYQRTFYPRLVLPYPRVPRTSQDQSFLASRNLRSPDRVLHKLVLRRLFPRCLHPRSSSSIRRASKDPTPCRSRI